MKTLAELKEERASLEGVDPEPKFVSRFYDKAIGIIEAEHKALRELAAQFREAAHSQLPMMDDDYRMRVAKVDYDDAAWEIEALLAEFEGSDNKNIGPPHSEE